MPTGLDQNVTASLIRALQRSDPPASWLTIKQSGSTLTLAPKPNTVMLPWTSTVCATAPPDPFARVRHCSVPVPSYLIVSDARLPSVFETLVPDTYTLPALSTDRVEGVLLRSRPSSASASHCFTPFASYFTVKTATNP